MSTVHSGHLTKRAVRLLELCEAEGFDNIGDLLEASIYDSVCPAICMECGCTAEMEPDQRAGFCEQCGQNKVVSCLSAIHDRRSTTPLIFDWVYRVQRQSLETQMARGAEELVKSYLDRKNK